MILKPRGWKISLEKQRACVSYHVFLPQHVFLSKIPNVPLKKYPAPFTRIRCILDPAPCAREGEEDRRGCYRSMRTRQSAKSPRVQKERIVCAPWSRRFDQWEQREVGSPLHRRRDRASSPLSPSFLSYQYLDPPIAFYLVSSAPPPTIPPTVNLLATI